MNENKEISREPVAPSADLLELMKRESVDAAGRSEVCRQVLRAFRTALQAGGEPSRDWQVLVRQALGYLGGQSDRSCHSLRDYDHHRHGPFLAISNEGGSAELISATAVQAPKASVFGTRQPLVTGIAIDGERLGGVGEVPIGIEEYAEIWYESVDRLLMTTNIGSRLNLRFYKRPPVVVVEPGDISSAIELAKEELTRAIAPFLNAPGVPRPLTIYIDIGAKRSVDNARALLDALHAHLGDSRVAIADIHRIGIYVVASEGCLHRTRDAIELAASAGIRSIAVDGPVRAKAGAVISLPGLLSYFAPEDLRPLLEVARDKNVRIEALNRVDVDSIARQVWSSLNTVRGMGFDLGKYSLLPLTLEQCDTVVAQIERDFSDWSAAPVCYVDQGIVASDHLYLEGGELVEGVKRWLRMIATHRVRLALIDTVDKAGGWKLVKVNDDPKGLLTMQQIASLNALGNQLNIRIMWAGGLEAEQVYALGRIGVFGLYVTTAVCDPMPVAGESYVRDPALSALKKPNPEKILKAKILLEAGFFASGATGIPRELAQAIDRAGMDVVRLRSLLQEAWSALAAA